MKIKLEPWAFMPKRAHLTDAGLDLISPENIVIRSHKSVTIDTGVHIQLPQGTVGILKSKSGLNIKHNITGTGTIDEGYTGSIRVKLYNNGNEDYCICCGDKIIQLVIVPYLAPELELVKELDETDRGDNGFGSTGR